VGALRETLAGVVFEGLGEMPETRRMSTTAERSAGCGVRSLRNVGGGVSDRGSARRQRLVAASSAPPPRATAISYPVCVGLRLLSQTALTERPNRLIADLRLTLIERRIRLFTTYEVTYFVVKLTFRKNDELVSP